MYYTPGLSLGHSVYDAPEQQADDFDPYTSVSGGVVAQSGREMLTDPTTTRQPRISAQFSSLANAHSWQGGWQTNWDHLTVRPNLSQTRQLNTNFNPNAPGRAEQQRATIYNAWPSAGALYPKAI